MTSNFVEEQIQEFREAFAIFDTDNDERVHVSDLGKIIRALGQNPTQTEIQEIIQEVDSDDRGTIDFPEFLSLMARKIKESEAPEEIIEQFKLFDDDGDGLISVAEMRYLMKNFGEKMEEDEINYLIDKADPDRDGYINYAEFIKLIMSK